jgi:hypothetical protein
MIRFLLLLVIISDYMTGPSGGDFGAEPPKTAGADLESCSNADWKALNNHWLSV